VNFEIGMAGRFKEKLIEAVLSDDMRLKLGELVPGFR
jgi:hypothetical protein